MKSLEYGAGGGDAYGEGKERENERMRRKMAQRRLVWKIEPFQSAWRAEALEGRQRSSSEP
jgi:hypothetical protein